MAQGDQGGLNPGLPGGEGSNWKVLGFPTVLVPDYSFARARATSASTS